MSSKSGSVNSNEGMYERLGADEESTSIQARGATEGGENGDLGESGMEALEVMLPSDQKEELEITLRKPISAFASGSTTINILLATGPFTYIIYIYIYIYIDFLMHIIRGVYGSHQLCLS